MQQERILKEFGDVKLKKSGIGQFEDEEEELSILDTTQEDFEFL